MAQCIKVFYQYEHVRRFEKPCSEFFVASNFVTDITDKHLRVKALALMIANFWKRNVVFPTNLLYVLETLDAIPSKNSQCKNIIIVFRRKNAAADAYLVSNIAKIHAIYMQGGWKNAE